MSEVNFFAFCITVIALTAISRDKDKVAEKALSVLSHTVGNVSTVLEKVMGSLKNKKLSNKSKGSNAPTSKK
jgi:hypothetical protein